MADDAVPRTCNPGEKAAETRSSQAPIDDPRRCYSQNSPCHDVYIFVTPPILPTLLMHLPSQTTLDILPRRFVSPASAAPTALAGPAFLASPGGRPVSPRPRRTRVLHGEIPVLPTPRLFLRLYELWIHSSRPRTSISPVRKIPTVLRPLAVTRMKRLAFQQVAGDLVTRRP